MDCLRVDSFPAYGPSGSKFEGLMWASFCSCSLAKIASAWSEGSEPGKVLPRKVSSVCELSGNALNTVSWYLARQGSRVVMCGAPLLPALANLCYIPYYFDASWEASVDFWSGREASSVQGLLSEERKNLTKLISNVSFLAYAVFETIDTVAGLAFGASTKHLLIVFKITSVVLATDVMAAFMKSSLE